MTNDALPKCERLTSRKQIENLFCGQGLSMAAYPLRVVYINNERAKGTAQVQMLVSVPKRHFKHAVDRNRVKRQVREAYRKHKSILIDKLAECEQLQIAFVWLADSHRTTREVESRVVNLLQRVAEKISGEK